MHVGQETFFKQKFALSSTKIHCSFNDGW